MLRYVGGLPRVGSQDHPRSSAVRRPSHRATRLREHRALPEIQKRTRAPTHSAASRERRVPWLMEHAGHTSAVGNSRSGSSARNGAGGFQAIRTALHAVGVALLPATARLRLRQCTIALVWGRRSSGQVLWRRLDCSGSRVNRRSRTIALHADPSLPSAKRDRARRSDQLIPGRALSG